MYNFFSAFSARDRDLIVPNAEVITGFLEASFRIVNISIKESQARITSQHVTILYESIGDLHLSMP